MSVESISPTIVCYEQPLNEPIRICLRIETLFKEFRSHINADQDHTLPALITLLKMINSLDRPDIKSKLTQTLSQYALSLSQLERFTQVDNVRLHTVLNKLDEMANTLHNNNEKIAARLKNNHFLNQLRLQIANPAGVCSNANALRLWQNQTVEEKKSHLNYWSSQLNDVDISAELILGLIRQSTTDESATAMNGFYQKTLNASLPCALISIKIDNHFNAYPEISAGKHRLTIRMMQPNYYSEGLAIQHPENIPFMLSCCHL